MAYSKAILTPSQVESQVIKIYNVTGLNLDVQTKNEDEGKQKPVKHHDDEVVTVVKNWFYLRNS